MAATAVKREPIESLEPEERDAKRTKICPPSESTQSNAKYERVVLNPADCNLDFDIEGNGIQGSALHNGGFSYCWSGARATVGITGGKYCFSCLIVSAQSVTMEDTPPEQQNICRLGISRGDADPGELGETNNSFGYGGTGMFSNSGSFSNYGGKFGVGDTITCAVNLEDQPLASISFSKNGEWLGAAMKFDAGSKGLGIVGGPVKSLQWYSALFPHVLLKNVVVQLQFSIADGLVPLEGYKPWDTAFDNGNAVMGPKFSDSGKCEVVMMVGLPAAGKTTWAEKWANEHPEKRYVLLGTNLALDQMKVPGLLRKHNYGERFDRLMDRATGIFNTLLSRACKTSRNYIIDQTNVYKNARKRKLKTFSKFSKTAVVVFPNPDSLQVRSVKRFKEMGKEVPAEAVNEMIANFILPLSKDMPGNDEFFDKVLFPELPRIDAQKFLAEMKSALGPPSKQIPRCYNSPPSRGSSVKSLPSSNASLGGRSGSYNQTVHENTSPVAYGSPYVSAGRDMSHRTTLSQNTAPYIENSPGYLKDDLSTRYGMASGPSVQGGSYGSPIIESRSLPHGTPKSEFQRNIGEPPRYVRDDRYTRYGMAGGFSVPEGPYGSPSIDSRSLISGFSPHGTPKSEFQRNIGEPGGSLNYRGEGSYEYSRGSSARSSWRPDSGQGYINDPGFAPRTIFFSPGGSYPSNGSPYQTSAARRDLLENNPNRSTPYGVAHFQRGPGYY